MNRQNTNMLVQIKWKFDNAEANVSVIIVLSGAVCCRVRVCVVGADGLVFWCSGVLLVVRSCANARGSGRHLSASRMLNKGELWHAYIEEPLVMELEHLCCPYVIVGVLNVLNASCHVKGSGQSVCSVNMQDSFKVTGVVRIMNTSLLWQYLGKFEQAKFVAEHVEGAGCRLRDFATGTLSVHTQIGWALDKHVNECCLLHCVRWGEETALLIERHGFDRHCAREEPLLWRGAHLRPLLQQELSDAEVSSEEEEINKTQTYPEWAGAQSYNSNALWDKPVTSKEICKFGRAKKILKARKEEKSAAKKAKKADVQVQLQLDAMGKVKELEGLVPVQQAGGQWVVGRCNGQIKKGH
eukprot:240170-Rhodomonas_salina.2